MLDAYMYTGLRSPFGRHAGALARLRPDDMLAEVIAKVVAESGFAADKVEDVVVGCANQGGEDSRCVARHAALVAGLPIEIPGSVLQRNCGSGLNAIGVAAQAITAARRRLRRRRGRKHEPRAVRDEARPRRRSAATCRSRFDDRRASRTLVEGRFGGDTMPETADNLARDYQITRGEADVFAAGSRKYAAAKTDGFYAGEIIAIEVPGGRAGPVSVSEDEHPRPQTDVAALAKLRPLFKDSVTTAGNASGINDGAVAMIVASRKAGDRRRALGTHPLDRGRVAPRIMGFGPVPAAKKALERAGLTIKDIDVIEINEAFASCAGLPARARRGVRRQPGQPERRRDRDRPSARRPGPRIALTAARQLHCRRALRPRRDVRRRRPGHRHGTRTGVARPPHPPTASRGRVGAWRNRLIRISRSSC